MTPAATSAAGHPTGRPVVRHVVVATVISTFLSLLITAGLWGFAQGQSRGDAKQVVAAVIGPLSRHDYSRPDGFDWADLHDRMSPFLSSAMVERAKLFSIKGDRATIVFSDDLRLEGRTGHLDPGLTERLPYRC